MKVFGHPLHIMLIHFPSALFPMDLICSLMALLTENKTFIDAGFYALVGGTVIGWLAVITGAFDLLTVMKNKAGSMNKALIHGSVNVSVLIAFSVLALIAFKKYPELSGPTSSLTIIKGVLIALMIFGNYLGGDLVLKDKVLEEK